MSALPGQMLRFGVVGSVGFVVDASVLLLLTHALGIAPLPARVLSFIVAASVTWKLNRDFTFANAVGSTGSTGSRSSARSAGREWAKYLLATAIGGAINVALYRAWVALTDASALNLLIGVAIGSIAAMGLNFLISKKLIFR